MDLLQSNALGALFRTINDLADIERQRAYKNAVPFVDVPAELLQQWFGHSRLLRDVTWFRELFTMEETKALEVFGELVDAKFPPGGPPLPDVPEIHMNPFWGEVMMDAHPSLKDGEVAEMVKYILGLTQKPTNSLPLKGSYTNAIPKGQSDQGVFILRTD